ncbi:MAG: MBL fold metallo-hydrolase [Nitrospinae bacterium]|nr:MBL fold metallo-hydrolase [Nitrospinota bacterium]MZH41361.1 MBL fold metallo-hydrolase [Nitrospinota bacterium]MZH45446.1 MBL fold metallo-hydrolase [Nitrospinota bacterium]
MPALRRIVIIQIPDAHPRVNASEPSRLKFSILSSGSGGNALYIEADDKRILIDAGLSEKKLSQRMAAINRSFEGLNAVFATHEHTDHIRGIGPLLRKHKLQLFTTEGTFKRASSSMGTLPGFNSIRAGQPVEFGELLVEPYSTPHDAEEPVAFVFHYRGLRLGLATDLGRVTREVKNKLQKLDALLIESNHDINMLDAGPYPWITKRRIKSDVGHLSNEACGDLLSSVKHSGLRLVVLMHMSETNNHPELAMITARQALGQDSPEMIVAEQNHPTPLMAL